MLVWRPIDLLSMPRHASGGVTTFAPRRWHLVPGPRALLPRPAGTRAFNGVRSRRARAGRA